MKKRLLSLALAFVLAFSLLPATVWAAEGTADDLIEISSKAELIDFRNKVNAGEKNLCAKLTKDITLSEDWTPISSNARYPSEAFSGIFDGNGHTIKGLRINASTAYQGFFAYTNGATIKNLTIDGSVTSSENYVGGIVGNAPNTTIQNCLFSGSVTTTKNKGAYVGGIAGYAGGSSTAAKTTITGCVNKATVTGEASDNAGGIAGYAQFGTISYCYNTGKVSGKTGYAAGIVGNLYKKSAISYSYDIGNSLTNVYGYKYRNATIINSYVGNGASNLLNEGDGNVSFVADENNINNGYPILSWQAGESVNPPAPTEFSVSLNPGSKVLQMVNSGEQPSCTFEAVYEGTDDTRVTRIDWCVGDTTDKDGNANEFESEFVDAQVSENDDRKLTVTAKAPGTAYVTATVSYTEKGEEKTMRKTAKVTAYPHITTVEIKNVKQPGAVAVGQTVRAQVNILGGGEYDYENYPKLTYQWYQGTTPIQEATNRTYTISDGFKEWDKIGVNVACNGEAVHSYDDDQQSVRSAEYGKLYPVAYDEEFTLPSEIKEDTKLELPTERTKGDIKAGIEWSGFNEVIAEDGTVTRPADGKSTVTLKAKFTYGNAYANRTFEITVWSQAEVDKELSDQQRPIKEALKKALEDAKFGEEYLFRPDSDTDENILTMFRKKLSDDSIKVSIKAGSVERYNGSEGTAGIDEASGKITYFYIDDLDHVPASHGTVNFNLTFVLSKDGVSLEYPAKAVFGWDKDQVRAAMEQDICGKLTAQSLVAEGDSADAVTQDLTLPFNVNGRTWAQAAWTSSNTAVLTVRSSVGAEPAAGVIRPAEADTRVTLTARYAFTYDDSITLSETFDVVIKAKEPDSSYQRALDAVFTADKLTDAATGAELDLGAVKNDIQFPTTRDLSAYMMAQFGKGFDGKYTPLVITSSDTAVIAEPDVANAARVAVYRPAAGEEAKPVTLTVKILDRPSGEGRDYAAMPVLAEKRFTVTVQPLTEAEITNELALMAEVEAHYWDGIRNGNSDPEDVTTDLAPFVEVYKQDGQDGALVWVRDVREMRNSGIVPVAMKGWQELEAWRLFRSSNPAAVTHENLLVTQQFEGKAVTVTSALSSETLGRYGELYQKDPVKYAAYAACDGLYYQPVSAELVVRGRNTANMVEKKIMVNGRPETRLVSKAVEEKVTVSFTLSGNGELWLGTRMIRDLDEGVTVFDVLEQLRDKGVSFKHKGGYVQSITCNGKTLAELDEGKNSGWLYTVNGELPDVYMSAYGLKNGDSVRVYFTKDYTKEPGADRWKPITPVTRTETVTNPDGSTTKTETKPDGTTVETTTKPDGSTTVAETKPDGSVTTVEKRADGTEIKTAQPVSGEITASVSVPKSVGSTRVDIPVSKPSGSMVAVIVHPDGTEEIVRGSVVTETGIALRAEGDVRLKIIDNAKRFNDMADHWAKDAVEFASSRELFNGVGNDAFGPDLSMTRGMVSTVLARLAGADTAGGETWYAKGTAWAVENGISDGTAPEQPVTREQLAAMLYRYAGSPAVSGELGFDDADSISAWARDAVRWCVDNGILNGVGGNRMTPQDLARRGQVAAMLMRFLQATV